MSASPAGAKGPPTACQTDGGLLAATREVRDRCFCLHLQAAARAVGNRFDAALRPLGLTSDGFALLVMLSRTQPPRVGDVRQSLAMDDAGLAAALDPLLSRRLLTVVLDPADERDHRLELTPAGVDLLAQAIEVWRAVQESLGALLAGSNADALRADLLALAFGEV